ncbi:hypothetical protein, partial [Kitasatospora sp. NPDC090091]|uniref:hypothetical protein n=1 Tax=Kitasatospora sp. NPDC090091 TaxID=3364081 RepID=UPI00381D376D
GQPHTTPGQLTTELHTTLNLILEGILTTQHTNQGEEERGEGERADRGTPPNEDTMASRRSTAQQ